MKKTMSLWSSLAASATILLAVLSCGNGAPRPVEQEGSWKTLSTSLEPIRDHFNRNRDRPRFVALLSPT